MQMGNDKLYIKQANQLCSQHPKVKCNNFTKQEIVGLLKIYNQALKEKTSSEEMLDRLLFRDILHQQFGMTEDIIMDRIFRAFDRDMDSRISTKEWIEGLNVFLRGTLEERIEYTFMVFDLNGDGYISREEMFQLLKNSLVKQPTEEDPDEGVKDLVEITLKKMDEDHDSRLSIQDFTKAVNKEPLLLESFGACLPDDIKRQAFEELLLAKSFEKEN